MLQGAPRVADEAHRPVELRACLRGKLAAIHPLQILLRLPEQPRRSLLQRTDVCRRLQYRRGCFRSGRGRRRRRGFLDRASWRVRARTRRRRRRSRRRRLGLRFDDRLFRKRDGNRHTGWRRRDEHRHGRRRTGLHSAARCTPHRNDNQQLSGGGAEPRLSHYDVEARAEAAGISSRRPSNDGASARAGGAPDEAGAGTWCRAPARTALRSRRRAAAPCDRRARARCRSPCPSS